MSDQPKPAHVPAMSPCTRLAIQRLRDGKPGDLITRGQMTEITGKSCESGTAGDGNIRSAIKHVEGQYSVVWRWSRADQAWRCLDDAEKTTTAGDYVSRARRQVRRGGRVAATVDESKLTPEQLAEHRLRSATIGTVLLFTDKRTQKRVEQAASGGRLVEPTADSLARLFERK